jgi:hypothetical protein
MKIMNSPKVLVTVEDLEKLLVRFVEKKTGKKVESVEFPKQMQGDAMRGAHITVTLPAEVSELEEPKNG